MAGIQISGLLSNQAFDWKSVVDQLIAADSIPVTKLQQQKDGNTQQITALGDLKTAFQALQDSVQAIRQNDVFSGRVVSSNNPNTTWSSSSAAGAPVGTYTFAITRLATQSRLTGTADIGTALAPSADVTALTLANLSTASAITAGVITVAGAQVTIDPTDTLQGVFDKISAATGGAVTGRYNPAGSSPADTITLTDAAGELVLGAANDTSNFLRVMKLANSGGATASSSGPLGTVRTTAPLTSAGLRQAITAVDVDGNGSFAINNVAIDYNLNTDSLGAILNRINQSGAGVTATYDAVNDQVTLVNKETGDLGITATETAGGLLQALGLSGGTLARGSNAEFTVNGGSPLTSTSNTLDAAAHGLTGLSVTVNSETTETLSVASNTAGMQSAIEDFISKFNAVQDLIEQDTKVTVAPTGVQTGILHGIPEVEDWGEQLRHLAFDAVPGATGTIARFDNLGIDFDGVTGHLVVKDQGKLAAAVTEQPDQVQGFFLSGSSGMVPQMYSLLTTLMSNDRQQQSGIGDRSTDLDHQIATLQARIDQERQDLTTAFTRMLDAQSAAQSQSQTLTNAFFSNNKNN